METDGIEDQEQPIFPCNILALDREGRAQVERNGGPAWLKLTGGAGIYAFIRAELDWGTLP